MEILQHGNIDIIYKKKKFLCTYCDCIFKAGLEDYDFSKSKTYIEYTCQCPDCLRKVVRKEVLK